MITKQSQKIFERINLGLNTNQVYLFQNILDCYIEDNIKKLKEEVLLIFPMAQWNYVELFNFKKDHENQEVLWKLFGTKFHIRNAMDRKFHFKVHHKTYHINCIYFIEERIINLTEEKLFISLGGNIC